MRYYCRTEYFAAALVVGTRLFDTLFRVSEMSVCLFALCVCDTDVYIYVCVIFWMRFGGFHKLIADGGNRTRKKKNTRQLTAKLFSRIPSCVRVLCVCDGSPQLLYSRHMPHGREERLKIVRGPANKKAEQRTPIERTLTLFLSIIAPWHTCLYAGPGG